MATIKDIPDLPPADSLGDGDLFPVTQGSDIAKKATLGDLKEYIGAPETGTVTHASLNEKLRLNADAATALHEFKRMGGTTLRICLRPPSGMEGRIIQGLTFVPQTGEWYYTMPDEGTDWVDRSHTVVRSDAKGVVIDNSTDELLTLGHGQDLNHLYYLGTLTFLCQNTDGDGMTAFTYATGGNPIANKRQYKLTNAGSNHHTTIGLSANKRFVVAAWNDPDRDDDTWVRIFDVVALLAGSTGDRSSEYLVEFNLNASADYDGSVENNQHQQSISMDDHYVYSLNGYSQIDINKYLYAFRISDGALVHKSVVDSGKAFAATLGTGTTYEPEGLEWVQPVQGVAPVLMAGFRTGGSPNNNWVFPINNTLGCLTVNGDRSPMGIGIYFEGGAADIAWNKNHALQFSQYDGSTPPTVSTVGFVNSDGSLNWPIINADNITIEDDTTSSQFTIKNTNAGVEGVTIRGEHLSASPANNDICVEMQGHGYSDAVSPTLREYGRIQIISTSITDGAEGANIIFQTRRSGALANRFRIGTSLYGTGLSDSSVAGGVNMTEYRLNGGPRWLSGSGTPEGAVSAPVGSLFSRTDGGAGTSLYVKQSGTGNTGWAAK